MGSEKSHVDHFTQSWTLDSNQSLSLVIMHFQTTAIKIISLNGRNSQSKNRLIFFVITSLIRGRNSSGGKRCRDKPGLGGGRGLIGPNSGRNVEKVNLAWNVNVQVVLQEL